MCRLAWLLVLAWLLLWLRWSFRWWNDVDIDTVPSNDLDQDVDQEQVIGSQRIWLVADDEEVDDVDQIDPTDPEVEWEVAVDADSPEAQVDEADLNEIVELLEDVLE